MSNQNTPLDLTLLHIEAVISKEARDIFAKNKDMILASKMPPMPQQLAINNLLRRYLYIYSGKTNTDVTVVTSWINDDIALYEWLDVLDNMIWNFFKANKIIETIKV